MNVSGHEVRARRSVSRRLVMAAGAVALALALLMTAAQLRSVYQTEVAHLNERLDEIGSNIVPSLTDSVWQVDSARIDLLLDGIAHTESVAWVRLQDDGGQVRERGQRPAKAVARRSYTLVKRGDHAYPMGTLEVEMDDRAILAELKSRALSRALTVTTALAVGALLMLFLFRYWVTRHLANMAEYARSLHLDTLEQPLVLDKGTGGPPDEIDEVADSINRMRQTLVGEFAIRRVHEGELRAHRERLEELVAVRTEDLEAQRDAILRLANTDHLTGVLSRRHFYDCTDRETVRATRDGTPLALMMVDIDHFKRINDSYGHAVGDTALKAFANMCQAQLPAAAIFGRLGGEEFAIALPDTSQAAALTVAQLLLSTVQATRVAAPDGQSIQFTASIGVAMMDALDLDLDGVLKRCDEALYRAKNEGRNRVVLHVRSRPESAAAV
ncbi:GGDEF domain-containing protein [Lysobacter terrae]